MLKPVDPPVPPSEPGSERPVGELVHQLIEDGKAYARAEAGVVKAMAAAKGRAAAVPAGLFAGALLLTFAAMTALAAGTVLAFAPFLGPFLAGIAGLLIFGGLAGTLVWVAVRKIKQDI